MEIKLRKKPKNPIIIEGFPGFGLVGTIASEFLIEHLKTEQIGRISFEELPAMVAIHENKVVEPLGIFYNKEYNIVIVHAITASQGFEWKLADAIMGVAKQLDAKEVICLEGVGSSQTEDGKTQSFFYASDPAKEKKLRSTGIKSLNEGIIMGVTGALLLRSDEMPVSCIFSETHTNLPDSKAAAKIVEALDRYLGLKVDYKPLLEQAQKFEEKLKGILQQGQKVKELSDKKKLSYIA